MGLVTPPPEMRVSGDRRSHTDPTASIDDDPTRSRQGLPATRL